MAVAKTTEEVRAEAFVSDTNPFLQQTVLYTVRIYHRADVSELNPEPINSVGFSLERIDEPPKTTRLVGRNGQRDVCGCANSILWRPQGEFAGQ